MNLEVTVSEGISYLIALFEERIMLKVVVSVGVDQLAQVDIVLLL